MKIGPRGIDLIKHYEQCRLQAYQDKSPKRVWTIGWGHTRNVKPGQTISQAEADRLFLEDIAIFETGLNSLLKRPVKQSQYDALLSFGFNLGLDIDADTIAEGLGDSTLLVLANAGRDLDAAREFTKWYKTPGNELGLLRRRFSEALLYLADL